MLATKYVTIIVSYYKIVKPFFRNILVTFHFIRKLTG